ncbi:hypothetical protein AMS68_003387 [Peltaster fructicola]|uniref:UV-endonuclease UvdE n=1 Tax=Peltaster fructicola TaxID=286661 RepID=A0A6H0XTT7_9PEZI|nr:hypothetical protein AMS68_003387 [Peltaster fructicola]
MPAIKRKQSAAALTNGDVPPLKRRSSARQASTAAAANVNPEINTEIFDAPNASRASPDNLPNPAIAPAQKSVNGARSESPLSEAPDVIEAPKRKKGRKAKTAEVNGETDAAPKPAPKKSRTKKEPVIKAEEDADAASVLSTSTVASKAPKKKKATGEAGDPEADEEDEVADPEELKAAMTRPPPVNSPYLPLPWKGRLGYACLNTYLRASNPPIFSSRTCRIQSILEHRWPLQHPDQPEHPTKNRPDHTQPADEALGKRYLENICLANVRDIAKMIKWNERYGIRFLRLSSEMFPFASHQEYGYKLAPFAADALAEAGKVIAKYNHRVTTHPGQFTQLGSPRAPVVENAVRDLDYHDEMLSLLKLPEQLNKDAVMIIHMGGMFESKEETMNRFRENYAKLSQSVKNRVVLENCDMCYSVHDLLPICEELNIPFVLDWHHHNIIFDKTQIREGTADLVTLLPRILATWTRKGITPKMHYSEPTPPAITGQQRRKHNPRVASLPPCPPTMDLMIEAKDKEQAVFELMKNFRLPGYDTFNDIIPYERHDDNKFADSAAGQRKIAKGEHIDLIPEEDIGMGGPEGRVYWPPGMEEWLRPKKREIVKKSPEEEEAARLVEEKKKEKRKQAAAKAFAEREAVKHGTPTFDPEDDSDVEATPATKKAKAAMKKKAHEKAMKLAVKAEAEADAAIADDTEPVTKPKARRAKKVVKYESEDEE